MDLINGIQNAVDYIETHITEELDYEAIARQACVSSTDFQRIFSILCGYSVGEYIRSRRLALAGAELLSSNCRVIDVAVKYGYSSPDSFAKAFFKFHGVLPSRVRKHAILKSFSRLSVKLTLEGGNVMNYFITEKDGFKVVGRRRTTPYGGGTWDVARKDGSIAQMEALGTGKPFLGLCFGFEEDGSNDYMVGLEYETDLEGLESFTYPKASWVVYNLSGKISDDVLGNAWWYVKNQLLPELNYQIAPLPAIESYLEWDKEKNQCKVEIQIPLICQCICRHTRGISLERKPGWKAPFYLPFIFTR